MMNYQAALKDFKKVQNELTRLKFSEEITFDDNVFQLEIRTISMLIVRHYTGEIKSQGEIWGNHLVQIPKGTINNHLRLKNVTALVDKIVEDIESRIDAESNIQKGKSEGIVHHDDEGKPLTLKQLIENFDSLERTNRLTGKTLTDTSHLFEQSKAKVSELNGKLSQAEYEQAKLLQEIQILNQRSVREKSELAQYQTSVKQFEEEKQAELEALKRRLQDDIQRLQSNIDTLKTEKEILQEKLKTANKDLLKEQNETTPVINKLDETIEWKKQGLLNLKKTPRDYFKILVTTAFVFAIYLWFTLPKVLDVTMDVRLLWGVVFVLIAIFAILILSKKDDYKNNFLMLIIGLVLAFFSWLLAIK